MKIRLLALLLLVGCASPQHQSQYQPPYQQQQTPQSPGYKEAELAGGLYLLIYYGATDLQEVTEQQRQFWRQRADALCPKNYHSFAYFEYKARPKDGIGVPVTQPALATTGQTPVVVEGIIHCADSSLSYEAAEELLVQREFLLRN